MTEQNELDRLYREAQAALKAREYDRAAGLLTQILVIDEDYKDVSRLLAQSVKLKRRRWYNDPRMWGTFGFLLLVGLGVVIAPKISSFYAAQSPAQVVNSPTMPSPVAAPTQTLLPSPTPIPLTWKRISMGQEFERDTVTAIAIDPKDPDVIYVGTKNAGIYKSIDGGLSWRPAHHGLASTKVEPLLIDSQNPQILYAGTMGGIFKTEDGGENWSRIGAGISLVMDSQNSSHLYTRDSDGIYESTDQGKSWETVYSSKDNCPGTILSWAIHPRDGKTLFIGAGEECETGVYLSNDGGRTWTLIQNNDVLCLDGLVIGLDGQGNYYILTLCAFEFEFGPPATFDSTGSVYFYCDTHLCKFNLDGKQRITMGKPDIGVFTSITISSYDPNIIYVGGEGLSVSRDGGLTWTNLNNGMGSGTLQLDTGSGDVPILYIQPGECNPGVRQGDEIEQSLYISTDGGNTWNYSSQMGCYLMKDADGSTVYRLGTPVWYSGEAYRGWIWRSPDSGKLWEKVLTPVGIRTLSVHPFQSGILQIYTSWDGREEHDIEFISEDDGHMWKRTESLASTKPCYGSTAQYIDKYRPMAIDPSDGNHVFVIDNGALLESRDNCETTSAFATAPNTNMNSIAFDPNNSNTIYAGTDGGAYISYDSGATWGQVNDGLLGATVVYSIAVDKESNVYAATPYGVFKLEGK
jgi:photosystem II stability/assembly factor-like uncharacterized protein